jgi:Flp pilus assembly pilin Flp
VVIFRAERKKLRAVSISRPISTNGSHPGVKGGGSHHTIVRRAAHEHGQAMAEYAVILALVFLAAAVAFELLGPPIAGLYEKVVASFT